MFACSGPGAGATIARSIEIGNTHAVVAGGLFLASLAVVALGRRRWAVPTALAGLVALHPAWTIDAISGDCGYLKRDASWVFTGLGCVGLCWQVSSELWRQRNNGRTGGT